MLSRKVEYLRYAEVKAKIVKVARFGQIWRLSQNLFLYACRTPPFLELLLLFQSLCVRVPPYRPTEYRGKWESEWDSHCLLHNDKISRSAPSVNTVDKMRLLLPSKSHQPQWPPAWVPIEPLPNLGPSPLPSVGSAWANPILTDQTTRPRRVKWSQEKMRKHLQKQWQTIKWLVNSVFALCRVGRVAPLGAWSHLPFSGRSWKSTVKWHNDEKRKGGFCYQRYFSDSPAQGSALLPWVHCFTTGFLRCSHPPVCTG